MVFNDTVAFTNMTASENCSNISFLWDFGDGTTSILPNPSHNYASGGSKTVTLTATSNGVSKSVQRSVPVQKGGAYVDFTYTHNPSGKYFFTIEGSVYPGDYPSYYVKKNCSAHTGGNSVFPHYHLYGNYYVKSAIQIINFGVSHSVHSKTIFLRKNSNKSYTQIKAESLTAGAGGTIYFNSEETSDNSCGDEATYNLCNTKINCKKVNFRDPRSTSFSVDHYSLSSYLKVIYDGYNVGPACG